MDIDEHDIHTNRHQKTTLHVHGMNDVHATLGIAVARPRPNKATTSTTIRQAYATDKATQGKHMQPTSTTIRLPIRQQRARRLRTDKATSCTPIRQRKESIGNVRQPIRQRRACCRAYRQGNVVPTDKGTLG